MFFHEPTYFRTTSETVEMKLSRYILPSSAFCAPWISEIWVPCWYNAMKQRITIGTGIPAIREIITGTRQIVLYMSA